MIELKLKHLSLNFSAFILCLNLITVGCGIQSGPTGTGDTKDQTPTPSDKNPPEVPPDQPDRGNPQTVFLKLVNLKDIQKIITSKTLVVFDLDETLLLAPGHFPAQRYPVHNLQLSEPKTLDIFLSIKNKAHTITGLTARRVNLNSSNTGDHSKRLIDWLENQDFKFSSLSNLSETYFQYKGVTFTEHKEKGPVLKAMLSDSDPWDHIVFVDDKKKNLQSVHKSLEKFDGKLTLIHYIGAGKTTLPPILDENGRIFQQIPSKVDFASGWHSIVSLVYSPDHNQIFSFKKAKPGPAHIQALVKEIDQRFPMWKKYKLVPPGYSVFWDQNKTGLIKTYLEGNFLIDYFKKDSEFWKKDAYKNEYSKLKAFFKQLIGQNVFVKDLSTENLIFSDSRWYIIDSSDILENQPANGIRHQYRSPAVYGSLADKWRYTINRNISNPVQRAKVWTSAQHLIDELTED